MVLVTADPINPSEQYALISAKASGSVVFHYAVVKEQTGVGKATTCIDYQFSPDAEKEMSFIAEEIKNKWQVEDLLLIRRSGCLSVGEIISLAAASSPASEDAFDSCRYGISRLKKMTTVVKREQFADAGKGEL
jgi:molybdopterin synthase catalytic subunit